MKVTFTVDLQAVDSWKGVSAERRLACALEMIYRSFGLRCTGIERRVWGPDTSIQGRSSSPFHLHKGPPADGQEDAGDSESPAGCDIIGK